MSRTRIEGRNLAIGGAVGGAVVSVPLLTMMAMQGRFAVFPFLYFCGTGAVAGLAYGALTTVLSRKDRWVVALGVSGLFAPLLLVPSMVWYANTPWASPQPYPGADATQTTSVGAWGVFSNQYYSIHQPIDEIERYYDKQMAKTCESGWAFRTKPDCPDFDDCSVCREAQCKIPRLWMGQRFGVDLCKVSDNQTRVSQWDTWQD